MKTRWMLGSALFLSCIACSDDEHRLGGAQPLEPVISTGDFGQAAFGDPPILNRDLGEGPAIANVSEWTHPGIHPLAAIDEDGRAIVAWELEETVLMAMRDASGVWSGVMALQQGQPGYHLASVAMRAGNAAVAFGNEYQATGAPPEFFLNVINFDRNRGWTQGTTIGTPGQPFWETGGTQVALALNAEGRAWAVWNDDGGSGILHGSAFDPIVGWTQQHALDAQFDPLPFALSVDSAGSPHVAWERFDLSQEQITQWFEVATFTPDGEWVATTPSDHVGRLFGELDVGLSGEIYALEGSESTLEFNVYEPGRGFRGYETIATTSTIPSTHGVAALDDGLVAFFTRPLELYAGEPVAVRYSPATGWAEPEVLDLGTGQIWRVAGNRSGKVILAGYDEFHEITGEARALWLRRYGETESEPIDFVPDGRIGSFDIAVSDNGTIIVAWERAPNGWDSGIAIRVFDAP